jgi:hypothetical protein
MFKTSVSSLSGHASYMLQLLKVRHDKTIQFMLLSDVCKHVSEFKT